MRVLVACEFSGIVRDAFRGRGHDAWSCDILPSESPHHLQGDALLALDGGWDLMIAHPPCTYLSRAGARWWKNPERIELADKAADFVYTLRDSEIPRIAIENPIGQLNRRWRYPDQIVQPYHFGHPFSKATCLWLKNLPPLMSTEMLTEWQPLLPSNVGWNARKGQKSHKGHTRSAKVASTTFSGIADAMASQWGGLAT
jgi:site-specific DNA-cytosine methylase